MSDEIKLIAVYTKEYNDLLKQHNALMVVHTKTVNDCAEIECKRYEMKKDNVYLRKLNEKWMIENSNLQESLDGAQREIERLNEEICDNKLCINLEGE